MGETVFVYGPLADLVDGPSVQIEGVALSRTENVLPLAVTRQNSFLTGKMSDQPWVSYLYPAIGGEPSDLPGGGKIYLGQDKGSWDQETWQARWGAVFANAVSEISQQPDVTTLKHRLPMILARAQSKANGLNPKPAQVRSDMGLEHISVKTSQVTHRGFFLTETYQLHHSHFDGTLSDALSREVFVATDASIILPYDPKRDRVLLVEQFRMGPFGRGDTRPWMLEPVAGRVDGGETPEQTAYRECAEEAGLVLSGLEHIASHYCSPGSSTEYFHCYLGLCDLPELDQGQGGLDTEHEDIRTHVLTFEQAEGLLTSGEADNGPLILMLFWLVANRSRLRAAA